MIEIRGLAKRFGSRPVLDYVLATVLFRLIFV
jgi:hypothetical protein